MNLSERRVQRKLLFKRVTLSLVFTWIFIFFFSSLYAVPSQISYQGKLTNSSGVPINGNVAITFYIYNAASGGTVIWSEAHPSVAVTNGHFSVSLGSVTPLTRTVFEVTPRYLALKVGADAEMTPRIILQTAPYAFTARGLENILYVTSNVVVVNNGNNVGIGTATPDRPLTIRGSGALSQWISFRDSSDVGQWHMNYDATGFNIAESGVGDYRLFLKDGGNVGINEGNPSSRLDVNNGHIQLDHGYHIGAAVSDVFTYDGDQMGWYAFGSKPDSWFGSGNTVWLAGYGGIKFFTAFAQPAMAINSSGLAGVGTTQPQLRLHVQTSAAESNSVTDGIGLGKSAGGDYTIQLTSVGGIPHIDLANASGEDYDIRLGVHTNNKLGIMGGNVGIGNTNPTATLHVSGGAGSTSLLIEADTDNVGEGDHPSLTFSQDGGIVIGRLGYFNTTNRLSLINEYTDALVLGTSNLDRLTILANGNVGIGTGSPAQVLDVSGNIQLSGAEGARVIRFGVAGTSAPGSGTAGERLTLWGFSGAPEYGFGIDAGTLWYSSSGVHKFYSHSGGIWTERMRLDFNGNLGIAHQTPIEKLHVAGHLRLDASGTSYVKSWGAIGLWPDVDNSGDDTIVFLNSTGGENMRISSAGNVGIGSVSPSEKLVVGGGGNADIGGQVEIGADQTFGGLITRVFGGTLGGNSQVTFDLFTLPSHSSSFVEVIGAAHETNSSTEHTYYHKEFACYRNWTNAPTVHQLVSHYDTVVGSPQRFAFTTEASGNTIRVRLNTLTASTAFYKIIVRYTLLQ